MMMPAKKGGFFIKKRPFYEWHHFCIAFAQPSTKQE
jgi:hypothetical protein